MLVFLFVIIVLFGLSQVASAGKPKTCRSPSHFVQLLPEDPEAFPNHPVNIVSQLGRPRGLLPVGCALEHSGGIFTICPSHFI